MIRNEIRQRGPAAQVWLGICAIALLAIIYVAMPVATHAQGSNTGTIIGNVTDARSGIRPFRAAA